MDSMLMWAIMHGEYYFARFVLTKIGQAIIFAQSRYEYRKLYVIWTRSTG